MAGGGDWASKSGAGYSRWLYLFHLWCAGAGGKSGALFDAGARRSWRSTAGPASGRDRDRNQSPESQAETLAAALARAKQQTIDQPTNVGNWLRLAQAAAMADDNQTEIRALTTAMEMTGGDVTVKSMLAEALSRAAGGQITVPARTLIASVLDSSPDEPRALYLAGLAAYQDEDYARAVSIWQNLQSVSAVDAPWMTLLDQNIADAAAAGGIDIPKRQLRPGPDQADIAAANEMTEEERRVMIEGMVSGLAEKLAENPDDVEGGAVLGAPMRCLAGPRTPPRH